MRGSLVGAVCALSVAAAIVTGCSLDRMATRTVAKLIATDSGQDVFAREDDPQFAAEALPFTLKLHELLVASRPDDAPLQLATGRGFISYSRAFIHIPAELLPNRDIDLRIAELARAKQHYLRGREHVLIGLETRHPGFRERLAAHDITGALALVDRSSIAYLYWLAAAWLGAFATDPFDVELLVTRPQVEAILDRIHAWDADYEAGAIHEIMLAYYAGLPPDMGGSEQRARGHFARAVELSAGTRVGPYVTLASTIAVRHQNADEYRDLLEAAQAIELDVPEYRLENTIAQRQARWFLDHIEDYFLEL